MLLEVRTVAILGMLVTKREPCGRAGGSGHKSHILFL